MARFRHVFCQWKFIHKMFLDILFSSRKCQVFFCTVLSLCAFVISINIWCGDMPFVFYSDLFSFCTVALMTNKQTNRPWPDTSSWHLFWYKIWRIFCYSLFSVIIFIRGLGLRVVCFNNLYNKHFHI